MGQEGGGRYLYTTANSLYNAVRHHLGHVFLNLNNGNAGLLCARGHECAQNYEPISQFYESCSQYPLKTNVKKQDFYQPCIPFL